MGVPHARGDEPWTTSIRGLPAMEFVFPTHVGMNRTPNADVDNRCVPHARGDEPGHRWQRRPPAAIAVFPTHVGMNRSNGRADTDRDLSVFPTHVGMNRQAEWMLAKCSPRTWG